MYICTTPTARSATSASDARAQRQPLASPKPNHLQHVLVFLQIERSLILQPPSVILYAANLLAVVVWDGVLRARGGGICPVALHAGVERLLFLHTSCQYRRV